MPPSFQKGTRGKGRLQQIVSHSPAIRGNTPLLCREISSSLYRRTRFICQGVLCVFSRNRSSLLCLQRVMREFKHNSCLSCVLRVMPEFTHNSRIVVLTAWYVRYRGSIRRVVPTAWYAGRRGVFRPVIPTALSVRHQGDSYLLCRQRTSSRITHDAL